MACISGFTIGGYYNYIDCCGYNQTGLSSGLEEVCVDVTYSGSAIGVILDSGSTCSISTCNQGPITYNFQVTGVCSAATGTVVINGFGGVLPFTIDPVTPLGSGLSTQTGNGPFTYTGLTGGTYVFRLNDSLGYQNNEVLINVNITDCFTAQINNVSGTTCGLNNGSFSVSATSIASPYNILLYKDGSFNQLQITNSLPYNFNSLSEGIYYAEIYDYGYSTAKTENVVVSGSSSVDFGFWKINTSTCVINQGKLAATGVTGNGPFTYLWSNGETTQLITGLTQGTYTCTITDSLGCSTTKGEIIGAADALGVGLVSSVNPTCFSSDGSLSFTITGGTRPLYYSASTSQVGYTFGDTFTINNLSSGSYFVDIRDANFCNLSLNQFLSSQNGFNVVDTVVTNSKCDQNNGSIYVEIAGLSGFYNYYLSGQTTGYVFLNNSQNQYQTFNNLANDTYLLIISGSGTNCTYTDIISVNSNQKFPITTTITGSTCGLQNGVLHVDVGTGYTGVLDYILSDGQSIIDTTLTSYTFNNLTEGTYTISVVDSVGCTVSKSVVIPSNGELITSINKTNCTNGNDGTAQVVIYGGSPTFTYEWSNNVPVGQTGATVNGLSGGSYNVKITDSNGCTDIQSFDILCTGNLLNDYVSVNLCKNVFTTTTGTKRGMGEMLNEGFIDLTSGFTNCYFSSATFTCNIEVNGSAYTQTFYTSTSLDDYPQDTLWVSTIEGILSTIPEIGDFTINILNNKIEINTNCNDDNVLGDTGVVIGLTIDYSGISCYYNPYKQFQDLTYFEFMTGIPYQFQ